MKCRPWLLLGAASVIMLQPRTNLAEPQAATPAAPEVAASPAPEVPPPAPPPGIETAPAIAPAASATEKAQAYFYRKKKFAGSALNTSVHVDDVEIAELDPGRYVKVPLQPGSHSFYCDEKDDSMTLEIEAGKPYYFRIELAAGMWKGHGKFKLMSAEEGAKEFGEWKLKLADDIKKPEMVVEDESKRGEK